MAQKQEKDSDLEQNELDLSVEKEPEDPNIHIDKPFDPEKIKVNTKPILVEQLVSRIKHEEVDLSPDFQRLRGVWDSKRQSSLIESLLLRIPLPVFYVSADDDENWSVVDGLQRMSTISDYHENKFSLCNLEYLTQLNGKKFEALPRPMQRRINETALLVHVIDPGTPEEVKFNIFKRINTGGLTLNGQEIRNALHKGIVRKYLADLATSESFLEATRNSIPQKRMADRECVLRFLAFYISPWEDYKSNDLNGYLSEAMSKVNSMPEEDLNRIKSDFQKAMKAAYQIFGDDAFRKRYKIGDGRKPISKALFEAWSVQLASLSTDDIEKLILQREKILQGFIDIMNDDKEFEASISFSTGIPRRVNKRFNVIQELVQGMLK